MRKKLWALLLALAVVVSLPCRAQAETPNQFYNNVASALGVTIDVYSTAWQDKTKAAYLSYIENEMQHNLTSPNAIYDSAYQLEQLTGYDIVYAEGGILYMNTVTDQAGGAFGGVQVWWPNYSTLLDNYVRWVRLAVNEGPAWPHAGTPGQPGGGDGSTVETYGNTIPLMKRFKGASLSGGTYNGDIVLSVTDTQKNSINNFVNGKYSCLFYITYANNNTTGSTTSSGFVARSNSPITISTSVVNDNNVATTLTSNSAISYKQWSISGTGNAENWSMYRITEGTPDLTGLQHTRALYVTGGVSIPEIPGASDDTPPSSGDVLPITITWPDISYTGPTYNYEGDTYNTTSGDIDWSPVTDRLDEMAEQFELFAGSFESLRSDFLQMWHALGGGLQGISGQLTTLEGKLNRVIDWLINIFNKTGGGAQATQPNPDTDEGGFWDWLGRLLDKLVGNLPEGVADFTSALSQLTGRFPFSVPWDLAALLGLFAHEPITPRATFYLPTVTEQGFVYDAQNAVPLVVDLTSFNDVASLARGLQYIVFALALAKWSIDGMRGIDWTLFG